MITLLLSAFLSLMYVGVDPVGQFSTKLLNPSALNIPSFTYIFLVLELHDDTSSNIIGSDQKHWLLLLLVQKLA
ncbi:hypothetical protein pCPXV0006 [Cowpox virus]|uniref:Uncharacterized protein n=1 Tax=Cowpox virus TaxID=10243 RepID=A0A0K2YUA9_COWPX|nr:hypothetical protein pCPXV0006 [Cowpox virus]CRL87018.1 hypothetical protein pCPXV0006 [Cowpox virus]CUI02488.1 hypothetical protein pCPXV0006 [Cowpox virus]SNB48395.1 hypothetical protein pCPXV0006 [Cowpox virus]SNB48677.1 hypothetical protein pCPXV0006 [Cowpox virus]